MHNCPVSYIIQNKEMGFSNSLHSNACFSPVFKLAGGATSGANNAVASEARSCSADACLQTGSQNQGDELSPR